MVDGRMFYKTGAALLKARAPHRLVVLGGLDSPVRWFAALQWSLADSLAAARGVGRDGGGGGGDSGNVVIRLHSRLSIRLAPRVRNGRNARNVASRLCTGKGPHIKHALLHDRPCKNFKRSQTI